MADPALSIFGHPSWTPDQKRAALERLGDYETPDDAAGVRAVQDPRVPSTPHEPPRRETQGERFEKFERLGTGPQSAPVPPRSSAPAAVARSAAAAALDTAALPVTVPAKLYRAAGGRGETLDTVADLSADEALQDATWLATGEEAGDYRSRVAAEREQFPNASAAGTALGTAAGGFGVEGLAERGIARGITAAERVAKREATRAAVRREVEAAGGLGRHAKPWEPGRTRALDKAYEGATPEEATEIATGRALPREPDHRHNAGQPLPPVRVVVRTDVPPGKPPEVKYSDGNHRAARAKAAGATEILAEVEVIGRGARGGEKVLHRYKGPVPLFDSAAGVASSRARSAIREEAGAKQREYSERDLLDVYAHPTWNAAQKRQALERMGAH
jgi:hypothetical protein